MIHLIIGAIQPVWWVLIGMIGLPIIVFGLIHMKINGSFKKFKRKKK